MTDLVAQTSHDQIELVSFRIGEQEFCVDIMAVREIRGWAPATPLPQTPPYMRGVINLRGAVLPILDLAVRLELPATEPSARSVIIVIAADNRLVGLLVDAVSDILSVSRAAIQPTPDVACDRVRSFVRGLMSIDGRMISQIAVDRILPDVEAIAA
ncbi:MAG: chemotaxis protein CheW [Caulobacter sp.]|jgi:purine-binding chemotaxis protein CheW